MFDVAIFTDSTPEESLHGQGGFQFQSASPGITPTHEHAIMAAGLIHVVDPTWVRQPDPLTHPPRATTASSGMPLTSLVDSPPGTPTPVDQETS